MFKNLLLSFMFLVVSQLVIAKTVALPDFTDLVKQTGAAVVNITARHNAKEIDNNARVPRQRNPLEDLFGIPRGFHNPQERDSVAGGSGFIISQDGYILTNRHVVHDADEIVVKLVDRREFDAELIGEDEASDIALLKVKSENLPILTIGDADKVEIGQWVMAIGSPMSFEHSVTKGIVSAKGRAIGQQQYVPFIQTDVPINPGNSGGPLINMDGEVVGINSMIVSKSGGYMGLSFSIPIDVAMSVVDQLKSTGVVKRGLLGVNIQPVSQKMANYLGLETPSGALVTNVNKDSAAEKAGIQEQDVIVEFNGEKVATSNSLPPLVGSVKPGTKVNVKIVRDGDFKIIKAVLGGLDNAEALTTSSGNEIKKLDIGFEVSNLSSDEKSAFDLDNGVLVKKINKRSIQRAGLQVNDVIIKMGKTPIKSVKGFNKELKKLDKDMPLVLLVQNSGAKRFIVIERD
jgi:serine protease Do